MAKSGERNIKSRFNGKDGFLGEGTTASRMARLSRLIRRLALMRFPRQEIASLTGHDWLRFLDSSGGNGQFSRGPGRVLAQGPYMRTLPEPVDGRALTRLVRHWIQRNTGGC